MKLPYQFTLQSASSAGVPANQGACKNPSGTRLWVSAGVSTTVSLFELNPATYATINSRDYSGGLPAGISQLNGLSYDADTNRLLLGGNNHNTTPAKGWLFEIDPDTLDILATRVTRDFWCEGGVKYDGDFWVIYHNTHEVDRYSGDTFALIGSYDNGFTHILADVYYQSAQFYVDGDSAAICLPTHGSQTNPKTIDVSEWTGSGFTPRCRVASPLVNPKQQGFSFSGDQLTGIFAERDAANAHRVVIATVDAIEPPNTGFNPGSGQLTNLFAAYPRLNTALVLENIAGTLDGIVNDKARVYPILDPNHGFCMRFDGTAGAYINLGNMIPVGLTLFTMSMWLKVRATTSAATVIQGNASGANPGDWQITVNQGATGAIRWMYHNAHTLTTAAAAFTVGEWFHLAIRVTAAGAEIWVNGVLSISNSTPGQVGGGQVAWLGATITGSGGVQSDVFDLRFYDAVVDVLTLYNVGTRYELFNAPSISGGGTTHKRHRLLAG